VPNRPLTLVALIQNSGRSVGFIDDLNITLNFESRNEHLPPQPSYLKGGVAAPQEVPPSGGSAVHQVFNGLNGAPQLSLTQVQVDSVNDGTTQVHIFGFISYTDEFSLLGSRKTGFCYLYDIRLAGDFSSCTESAYSYAR
jgi:hypothetical protein